MLKRNLKQPKKMMLFNDKLNKNELEFLKKEFLKLGIYKEWRKKFYSKSVSVLWIVYESKTGNKMNYSEWR